MHRTPPRRSRLWLPVALAAGLTFIGLATGDAGPARAADAKATAADEAATASLKKHYEQGAKYYNIGKYDDAIKEFEAAYEAKPDPLILYNLAQAHRLAGHNTEALRIYKNHLRAMPDSPYLTDVQKHIADLEESAKNEPATTPPTTGGATTTPPPTTTTSGGTQGTGTQGTGAPLSLPGTGTTGTTTTPPPDNTYPPPTSTQPPLTTAPPPPDTNTAPPPPPMIEQPAPASRPGMSGRQKAGIIIAAIGAGSLLLGGVFGAIAKSSEKKIETASNNLDDFDPSVDKLGRASEKAEFVFLGVGLAAGITGAVLYLTAPKAETEAPQPMPPPEPTMGPVSFLPTVSRGGAGALLRMSF